MKHGIICLYHEQSFLKLNWTGQRTEKKGSSPVTHNGTLLHLLGVCWQTGVQAGAQDSVVRGQVSRGVRGRWPCSRPQSPWPAQGESWSLYNLPERDGLHHAESRSAGRARRARAGAGR